MSDTKKIGTQSIRFSNPPVIEGWASVAGKKESQGPLGKYFDVASDTDMFSAKNWEEAESKMQMSAVRAAISKAGIKKCRLYSCGRPFGTAYGNVVRY